MKKQVVMAMSRVAIFVLLAIAILVFLFQLFVSGGNVRKTAFRHIDDAFEKLNESGVMQDSMQQINVVSHEMVVAGMNQITEVVQTNSGISLNAQETAKKLDEEAAKLIDMVKVGI